MGFMAMHRFILFLVLACTPLLAADKTILLIAGKPSHGPGAHEFRAGALLLQKCLNNVKGIQAVVYSNGWPQAQSAFDNASAVLIYADGGGGHPAIQGDRAALIDELAKKGVGLAFAHYAVEVPKGDPGDAMLRWQGGFYQHMYSVNPMWTPEFKSFPKHPVTSGVKPFSVLDEWYFNLRFRPEDKGLTPILVAQPSEQVRGGPYVYPKGPYPHIVADQGRAETMMWVYERPDGGRSFGFTGGHRHANWGDENFRKVFLNGLLWIAKADVPEDGVACDLTPQDLEANLDPKKK